MISVLICASEDVQALGRLLADLVPGAAEGVVREVAIVGAAGPAQTLADDAGADLYQTYAEAWRGVRAPWIAGLPLGVTLASNWLDVLSEHLARQPPSPARLAAASAGLGLSRGPEGWLLPRAAAPSAVVMEQDLKRLARRARRRLRILERR